MEETMDRFFVIEYQDWDENGNPTHEMSQEYIDINTGKAIVYRSREKAKKEATQLSSLTRTFSLNPMSYWIEKTRIKDFVVIE